MMSLSFMVLTLAGQTTAAEDRRFDERMARLAHYCVLYVERRSGWPPRDIGPISANVQAGLPGKVYWDPQSFAGLTLNPYRAHQRSCFVSFAGSAGQGDAVLLSRVRVALVRDGFTPTASRLHLRNPRGTQALLVSLGRRARDEEEFAGSSWAVKLIAPRYRHRP